MSNQKITELGEELIKAHWNRKQTRLSEVQHSKEVERITKEGLLHKIGQNEILSYAMQHSDTIIARLEQQEKKALEKKLKTQ